MTARYPTNDVPTFSHQVQEIGEKLSKQFHSENKTAWDDKILIKSSSVYANCHQEQKLFCMLFPAELLRSALGWCTKPNDNGNNGDNGSNNEGNNNDKHDRPKILIAQKQVERNAYHSYIFAYEDGAFATEEEAYGYGKELLDQAQQ